MSYEGNVNLACNSPAEKAAKARLAAATVSTVLHSPGLARKRCKGQINPPYTTQRLSLGKSPVSAKGGMACLCTQESIKEL